MNTLGGQRGTLLLTCLSLAHSHSFSHFHSPQSLSLSTHTQTLVTIKQVVLSRCLSPCVFLCAIYELYQLFLTVVPQLTSNTCMLQCIPMHRHLHIVCTLCVAPSHCCRPFTVSSHTETQSVQQEGHSLCQVSLS